MFDRDRMSERSYYETAQVCLNGHIITSAYNRSPELRENFCSRCGKKTIHQCPNCQKNIQGYYVVPGVFTTGPSHPPAYCYNCGKPFPWTESRLEAALELTLETVELDNDREKLVDSLPDLVTDTPKTTVAANRWRKALSKVGEQTASVFREIFIEVASETAKKLLFP